MSSSGQYQIACAFGTHGIYYSTNYGVSWTVSNAPNSPQWHEVCISASGQFASVCNATSSNQTYYSTNYGVTWTAATAVSPSGPFQGIACSASGQYQVAAIVSGIIYYSSNYGQTWIASNISNAGGVLNAAMSASGQYVTVVTNGTLGNVWYSSNYGVTFVSTPAGTASNSIRSSSISASGQYQLAAGSTGGMYYSINYGISWILGSAITSWFAASMSANAQYCVACVSGGAVYISMTREPPKILTNQNINTSTGLTILAPNIGASNNIGIILGQAVSNNNYATIGFQYVGAGSTNNYLYFGMNTTNTICIVNGQVGIGSTSIPQYCPLYVYSNLNSGTGWDGRGYFGNNVSGFVCGIYAGGVLIGGHNAALSAWANLTIGAGGTTVTIPGTLSKGGGTFDIAHPVYTDHKKRLVHSFIEGPRCDLIYRGTKQLVNGTITIDINKECTYNPNGAMDNGTFEALCANAECFLQNKSSFSRVMGTISGCILTITCENATNDTIIWMVIAERKDSFIKKWNRTDDNGFLITQYTNDNYIDI
jgi:hypothetical protein